MPRGRAAGGGEMSAATSPWWSIAALAEGLFGPRNPSLSTRRQLRFGTHGSLSVEIAGPKRGLWHDFESGKGGALARPGERHDRPEPRQRGTSNYAIRLAADAQTTLHPWAETYLRTVRGLGD